MKKKLMASFIGATAGTAAGTIAGSVKASIACFAPVLWVPAAALSFGGVAHSMSDGNRFATVVGAITGGVLGLGCLAAWPIVAPITVIEAACYPFVGGTLGAVVAAAHSDEVLEMVKG